MATIEGGRMSKFVMEEVGEDRDVAYMLKNQEGFYVAYVYKNDVFDHWEGYMVSKDGKIVLDDKPFYRENTREEVIVAIEKDAE